MSDLTLVPLKQVPSIEASSLLKTVMGDAFGRQKSTSLWDWKHNLNPAGTSLGYAAYTTTGELVALRPFMRWSLLDQNGDEVEAVRAVDTVVHPERRRSGLFSQLTTQSLDELEEEGIKLVFNTPNDRSGPGYQKLGWQMLGHPTVWIRPKLNHLFLRQPDPVTKAPEKSMKLTQDLAGLSHLPLNGTQTRGLTVKKDAAFLDWRYAHHPNLNYFLIKTSEATAVVREDIRAGYKGIALVDYFLKAPNSNGFSNLLKTVLRETDGAYVVTGPLPSCYRFAAVLRGFIPLPWRNVNLAAKPITWPSDAAAFQTRSSWQLTLGDLETF